MPKDSPSSALERHSASQILSKRDSQISFVERLTASRSTSRKGTRDYRKFLDTAWGSLAEVQTALTMARDIGYLRPAEFGRLEALATETSKTLFGLLRKISQAVDPTQPR